MKKEKVEAILKVSEMIADQVAQEPTDNGAGYADGVVGILRFLLEEWSD